MNFQKKTWLACYNYPTKIWTSGGTIHDYARPHYDLYEVSARSHDEARKAGQVMRRKQANLPAAQSRLLASILRECSAVSAVDLEAAPWFEVVEAEVRDAQRLASKGLLKLKDGNGRHVQLTLSAFNRFPSVAAAMPEAQR